MAEKKNKSQAEKAAMVKNQKASGGKKKAAEIPQKNSDSQVPARLISSVVSLALFILFLVVFMEPEGLLIDWIHSFVLGLFGKISFYVSIPALLYLFVIQAFSGRRPVRLRSWCLVSFVLICGCVSQLMLDSAGLPEGFAVVSALYDGGQTGETAGLICGGISMLLEPILSIYLAYIVFGVAGILCLLASFQITIPSIIRAVQNRPRADWENEEFEELEEPAAVVVNHIANKRIEYVENKRRIQEEQKRQEEQRKNEIDVPVDDEPVAPPKNSHKISKKANDFMNEVDVDVETPVAAAKDGMEGNADVDLILDDKPVKAQEEPIPANTFVMQPEPAEMTPFEKHSSADSGAVHKGSALNIKNRRVHISPLTVLHICHRRRLLPYDRR